MGIGSQHDCGVGPMSWGIVLTIICDLFEQGHVWEGFCVWLQHDVCDRTGKEKVNVDGGESDWL